MLSPKGRRKKEIKPPFNTYISGYGNKALEYAGEIFFNRITVYTNANSVAKLDAMVLPEETTLTTVTPTASVAVPNEVFGSWTLTKLPSGNFTISGGGKGITKVSASLSILSETDLKFDVDYVGQQKHLPIMSQTYFASIDKIVSMTSYGSSKNLMSIDATTPLQSNASISQLQYNNGYADINCYVFYLSSLGSKLYAGDWASKTTKVLNTSLAVIDTINDVLYMLQADGIGYFVQNPLNFGGTIYSPSPGTDAILYAINTADNSVVASHNFGDKYIRAIAEDYASIDYIAVFISDSYPLISATSTFYLLKKTDLSVMATYPVPDLVGMDIRNGCMDSRGYSFFPLVSASGFDNSAGRIYRVPKYTMQFEILLHFSSYPFINSGTLPVTIDSVSTRLTTDSSKIIYSPGSLLSNTGSGNPDSTGLSLYPSVDITIQNSWTIRFKLRVNRPDWVHLFNGWVGSNIGAWINGGTGTVEPLRYFPQYTYTVPTVFGDVQEFSLELLAGVVYTYMDGILVGSAPYEDPGTHLPMPETFFIPSGVLLFSMAATDNDILDSQRTVYDEFIFVNGAALAGGASSYSVRTTPYTP
jgi:hypothetical protein